MNKIERLYNIWKGLQPLKAEEQFRLNQKFMLEFNYNSNHIEGNTLTYGQTELLLLFGQVEGGATMRDLEEMKAHNVCLKMVQDEVKNGEERLTEYFIRTLHHTMLREDYTVYKPLPGGEMGSYVVHAGRYKTRHNSVITVTGERFEYASPEETPALMGDLVKWYNEESVRGELSVVELAAMFHYRYIRIHPFEDGNGRIARLMVNYILLKHGYPMIVVKSEDKRRYLMALNKCDVVVGGVPSVGAQASVDLVKPLTEYLGGCLEEELFGNIKMVKGEDWVLEED